MIESAQSALSEDEGNAGEALILGHCILNMNTRAPGISAWRGAIIPLLRSLQRYRGEIHQYPCLEAAIVGMRRWWHVKEQYDTFTMRSASRAVAGMYADYFARKGVSRVKLLGLGLSPTCGYRYTQSDPSWGGRPKSIEPASLIKKGSGVLIEEMLEAFDGSGIVLEVLDVSPSLIYPDYESRMPAAEGYPQTPEDALKEIERFLGLEIEFSSEELSRIRGLKEDLRSRKTLVIPRSLFKSKLEKILEMAEEGYGFTLVEDISISEKEEELLSEIYASMIGNMMMAGHSVAVIGGKAGFNSLLQRILDILEEFFPEKEILIEKEI